MTATPTEAERETAREATRKWEADVYVNLDDAFAQALTEADLDEMRKQLDDLNAAILSWQDDLEAFVRGEELPSTGRHASHEAQEGV